MNLFHWFAANVHLLVWADNEEHARSLCLEQATALSQWAPERAEILRQAVNGPPFYVAEKSHVIAIDMEHP